MSYPVKILSALALVLMIWAVGYMWFATSAIYTAPEKTDQTVDAIVVLTGGQGRIETGLGLLADGGSENLYITGVHPYVKRSEIRALWKRDDKPLPNCCIMLGYKARSTQQNAQETRDWLADKDYKTIRLVTGNFHMRRALREFHHALPNIEIIPHTITEPRYDPHEANYWLMAFYEYNKSIFRWLVLRFEKYLPESIINLQLNPDTPMDAP